MVANSTYWPIAWAGDLDQDGYGDIVIGAPKADAGGVDGAGEVYVVYGPISGTLSMADADAKLLGGSKQAYAGLAVAAAGEVTGDAYPDLLVGAPYETWGDTVGGVAWVIPGGP